MSWNQMKQDSASGKVSNGGMEGTLLKGIIAALIVVACAAGAWWMLKGKEEPTKVPKNQIAKKSSQLEAVKPAAAPKIKEETTVEESVVAKERKERAEKLRSMTPAQRIDFLFEEAKRKPINLNPPKGQMYATSTEQVIAMLFTTPLGNTPPPLPPVSIKDEAHLAEILINRVEVKEGDSDKVAEGKRMVQLAKEELKKYIKEGGNIQDFLQYYHGQLVEANNELRMSRQEAMRVVREDPLIAREYINTVNKRLEAKGIKKLNIPPGYLKKFGVPDEE